MHLRAGEGLGEKDNLRVLVLDGADQPLPEVDGLGVRIVDAEDTHAVVDPKQSITLFISCQRLSWSAVLKFSG